MKILFVKVPWMKYYTGEGDEEKQVPSCGYIFQHVNGFYYGYSDEMNTVPIEKFENITEQDEWADNVTIIWTAINRDGKNKVIGWYKDAKVYRNVQKKLTQDSERAVFKYTIKAPAKKCILLPVELRLLDVNDIEEGIRFEDNVDILKDITMYVHNYSGDQMNFVFKDKDLQGQSVLNLPEYEMYFAKADEFLEKDLYGRAVRLFNKAIACEPDLAIGYECKGSILLSLKMYNEALKCYEKVLALEPDNEGAVYCVGLIKGLLDYNEECVEYLSKYLKKRKMDMIALAERGIAYYNMGKIEEAKHDFMHAYKNEPDNMLFSELLAYAEESTK